MKRKNLFGRPLTLFYILVIYVVTSFCWWTFTHFKQSKELRDTIIEKERVIYTKSGLKAEEVVNGTVYKQAERAYNFQTLVKLGESALFLIVLLLGAHQVRTIIRRELALSRQQRNFLLSITHELKSPIAGIKLANETLKNRPNLAEKNRNKLLANSLKDAERLKTLVENLLMAAKIDNQSMTFVKQEENLSKLTNDVVQKIREGVGRQHSIVMDVQPSLFVHGDHTALTSMITNLIENAVKYSSPDSLIEVNLQYSNSDSKARLSIADQGIGISEEDKTKIFTKFYRVGSEETRKTKGTGLGLFLVKQLTEYHNGKIYVLDNTPKGSIFIIEIPAIQKDATAMILGNDTKQQHL